MVSQYVFLSILIFSAVFVPLDVAFKKFDTICSVCLCMVNRMLGGREYIQSSQ